MYSKRHGMSPLVQVSRTPARRMWLHTAAASVREAPRHSDGSGGPNFIEGNGDRGWKCRENSAIWPTENQYFGTGNTGGNTAIFNGCVKQGGFF